MGSNPISRSILFLIFTISTLFSQTTYLHKSYFVKENQIFSTDLVETDAKFLLGEFQGRDLVQISSINVKKAFQKHGIDVDSEYGVVLIYNIDKKAVEVIKQKVKDIYEGKFKNINVTDVELTPRSITKFSAEDISGVDITSNLFNRTSGSLTVQLKNRVEHLSFQYKIIGYQKGYVANKRIQSKELITLNRVKYVNIGFKNTIKNLIGDQDLGKVYSKSIISENMPILYRMVKKVFDVKKDEIVKAKLIENGLVIEFTLISSDNGYIGDTVELKSKEGKSFRGVVKSSGVVEIR